MRFLLICVVFALLIPTTFAWSYQTHRNICETVYDNIPGLDKESLLSGCNYPDEVGDFTNHVCYINFCPAYGRAENYFKIGRDYYIDGDMADASFNFGVACHYISDSMQPHHTQKSIGEEHIWFEDIIVYNVTLGDSPEFFAARNESTEYVDDISEFYRTDDNNGAYVIADYFTSYAADLCYKMILNEIANDTKSDIPDCSTVKSILKNDCDLMDVFARGKITNIIHRTSASGNKYVIFYLTDGNNRVKVFLWGDLGIPEGSMVSVSGVFYKERVSGGYTFTNEIEAYYVKEDSLSPLVMFLAFFIIVVAVVTYLVFRK